jgi:hypothetical protein
MQVAAVIAWFERHGRLPSAMDWSPEKIRYRRRGNAEERIRLWKEGWVTPAGEWRPFPRANSIAFRSTIAAVHAQLALIEQPEARTAAGRRKSSLG